MELKYNATGSDRKRLVTAMAEIMECAAKYKGAPTFAYEVDYFTIDKNGIVTFDDRADSDEVEMLVEALLEKGFEPEKQYANQLEEAGDSLVISYPRNDISDIALENLRLLVASKEALIKKALGVDALPIEVDDKRSASLGLRVFRSRRKSAPTPISLVSSSAWQKRRSASPPRKRKPTTKNTRSAASCLGSVSSATSTRQHEKFCFVTSPAAVLSRVAIPRHRRTSRKLKAMLGFTTT